jgi:hypothetical protein
MAGRFTLLERIDILSFPSPFMGEGVNDTIKKKKIGQRDHFYFSPVDIKKYLTAERGNGMRVHTIAFFKG